MVSLHVDIGTLTGDTIVIKEIIIDKPEVTYELGSGGSNIDAIRKNVDAYMGGGGGGGAGKKEDKGEGPKLIIENFYVRGGTVNVSATILAGKTLSAALPDIHLKDIGKEDDGATPGQVAEKILAAIGDGASSAVASIGVGKTLDSLKQVLGGTAEGARGRRGHQQSHRGREPSHRRKRRRNRQEAQGYLRKLTRGAAGGLG